MKCPFCGADRPEEESICSVCGNALIQTDEENAEAVSAPLSAEEADMTEKETCTAEAKRHRRWPWILLVVLLVLGIAVSAFGGYWAYNWYWKRDMTVSDVSNNNGGSAAVTASRTVRVTIPEGYTANQIAELMESSGVCSAEAFYAAVQTADFSDYPFVAAISAEEMGERYIGRACRLEGYLFPDTYEFYRNSSGEAAVRRFLANFQNRLKPFEEQLATSERSWDDTVILASLIQWEAAYTADMGKVSRVLCNRLENPSEYPRLQCDSTYKYIREWNAERSGVTLDEDAYDTYVRRGLPAGAISNPGLDALQAAISPSEDEEVKNCYFFATDYKTGITYYSRTYAEHVAVCREHGIGVHAED